VVAVPNVLRPLFVSLLVLAGLATPVASAATGTTVNYHGYEVLLPDSWLVVDLAARPQACVRLDRPTVYLGHPGERPDCPARLVGRTAGLVIEPIDETSAQRITPDVAIARPGEAALPADARSVNGMVQLAVLDAGVLVTAEHTPDTEQTIRDIMGKARLVPGGEPVHELPRPDDADPNAIVAPGTFLGRGFDACTAPSQSAMNAWRTSSPYRVVGVYISGSFRGCSQPNLTASWVSSQAANGWRFILIDVGRQAPCTNYSLKISTDPATARSQGRSAAQTAMNAASALGFGAGSAIYSDIESYTSTASCKAAVLSYVSGWTQALNGAGFLSGVYSSAASGIRDLSSAYNDSQYTRPDHIWFAWWNGQANTDTGPYAPAGQWANHQRLHQYVGESPETYGGVRINIDRNYLDVASGTPPPPPPPNCGSANLDFTSYGTIRNGSSGPLVLAAQCLLETNGYDVGAPNSQFGAGTESAVRAFQQSRALAVDGVVGPRTWTALLSAGSTPTLQNGSTGEPVRRLQRALTVALARTVGIDGIFGSQTGQAVRDYQSSRALGVDGIVGQQTWGALQAGR
jgi:Domain of unknown function (DUF1906)/Putative peptidoglycan binding domain